ncbi:MAG: prolipoprotein diacylglyceryl transferase [Pseudomonadota bacterium]
MLTYPEIDEIAFSIDVRWYGLMYLAGFACAWYLATLRARRPNALLTVEQVGDFIFYGAIGVIAGGRLGYVLFYGLDQWADDWLFPIKINEGGMSFHGGLLGVITAMLIFARQNKVAPWRLLDFLAPVVPPGLFFGRIGNFINNELWGKQTTLPWGFKVGGVVKHPSQLYEALLEGLVLFLILWFYSSKPRPTRAVSGLFLIGYGTFRLLIEFVRIPDAHLGYLAFGWLTMGHLLSLPMVLFGAYLIVTAYRSEPSAG